MTLHPLIEATKICPACGKKKVMSAFYENPRAKDGRGRDCIICISETGKVKQLEKAREEGRNLHLFRGEEKCLRCGVVRRKKANVEKVGQYISEYFINSIWVRERPVCIPKNSITLLK